MKRYKSIIWKYPDLSFADNKALQQLRRHADLQVGNGVIDPSSPLGWVNDYFGPALTKDEQDLLMVKEIS